MIRITTGRRGTMIRARGKDAQRLFELFSQVSQEKAPTRATAATPAADTPRVETKDASKESHHG